MVYQEPEEEPAGWDVVDLSRLIPEGETELPFTLIANRFASSTGAADHFIHEPLTALIEAQGDLNLGFEITTEWRVSTFIVNHHQTLRARHLYAMASLKADEKTAGVTMVKRKPDNES